MQSVQKDQIYGSIYFPKIDLNDTITGVLLDIDNTIYSYDHCHKIAFNESKKRVEELYNIRASEFEILYAEARERVNIDLLTQASSHSRILYFQKIIEKIEGKTNLKVILELEKTYWNIFLENMSLLDNVEIFLKECLRKKIKICIITDLTAEIQMKKLLKLKIDNYINYVVTSEEAGVEKPHPYIFKLCLEKLNMQAKNVIIIGDNPNKDIKGAKLIGIKFIVVGEK